MEEKIYNPKAFKTTIGGQALIEGVMMKGPSKTSVAVRKPNKEIELKVEQNSSLSDKYKILNLPIIRGAFKLIEAMVVGVKALTFSASFFEEEEDNKGKKDTISNKIFKDKAEDVEMFLTIVFSFAMAIVFFMALPSFAASFFKRYISNHIVLNLIEGLLRIIIFLVYLYYVTKIDDIKRVFEYHGAEHKSIHCYESGEELTVENVLKYPRMHPRCGTSFLFMVLIVSIFTLSFFGWPSPLMRVVTRILMFPVIAGISYEINRVIGKSDSKVCKVLSYPGIQIQRLATVREPDADQVEVAIAALKAVVPQEGESDQWK